MTKDASYRYTVDERVIRYLMKYYKYRDEFRVPFGPTQMGIAKAVDISRNSVPRTIKKLKEKGFVMERTAHVEGVKRRRKVYFLTDAGMSHARRIRDDTEKEIYVDYADHLPKLKYFFGRKGELDVLSHWVYSPDGRVVVIHGIAGIGKTTFVRKAVASFKQEKNIFWYRFYEWSTLANLCNRLAAFLQKIGRVDLKKYLEDNRTMDPDGLAEVVSKELTDSNVLLVFDDVHKIQEDIWQFFYSLREMTENSVGIKVIMLGRYIKPFYDRREVVIKHTVLELALWGLDKESSRQLIEARNRDLGDFERIYELTEGNPLFLELVGSLEDLEIQSDIKKYIQEEIYSRLGKPERNILRIASVYRYPVKAKAFFPERRKSLQNATYDALEFLVSNSLVKAEDFIYDVHDIIKEFFYRRLEPELKKEFHEAAADYYLSEEGSAALIEAQYHLIKAGKFESSAELVIKNGTELLRKGYSQELLQILNMFSQEDLSPQQWVDILSLKGHLYDITGKWDEAVNNYSKALDENSVLRNLKKDAEIRINLGQLFEKRGELNKALKHYERGLNLLEMENVHTLDKAKLYRGISLIYLREGDFDKAIEYTLKDLEIVKAKGDQKELAKTYNNLGMIYWSSGRWKEAISYHEKGLSIKEKMDDSLGMARSFGNLGLIYFRMGKFDDALEYWLKGTELFERIGDIQGTALTYTNIGCAYQKKKDFERAEEYQRKCLEICERSGFKGGLILAYLNLASLCLDNPSPDFDARLEESEEYCKKTLALSREVGDMIEEANAYKLFCQLHRLRRNWKKSELFFKMSMTLFEGINSPFEMGEAYYEFGLTCREKGDVKEAEKCFKSALDIFIKLGADWHIQNIKEVMVSD